MGYSGQPDPSQVPQFTPPVNPATPIHHGFLSNILSGLQSAGNAVGNTLSPVPQGMQGLISPEDLQHAKSAGWLALGSSLLNPTLDARGFKQSTLGSIASGLQNGQQASAQSMGGALQASQYAAGLAQQQRVLQGRAQIQQLLAQPMPDGSAPDSDARIAQLMKAQGIAAVTGDDKGAEAYARMASALRPYGRGINGATPDITPVNLGDRVVLFDHRTGKMTEVDGTPVADASKHEIPSIVQEKAAKLGVSIGNLDTHRDAAWTANVEKPFVKQAQAVGKWGSVYQEARGPDGGTGNEAASKAALAAFMGAVDANVQLRMSTFQTMSQTAPALMDRIRRYQQGLSIGTIPQDQLDKMNQVIQHTAAVNKVQYNNTVNANLKHFPDMASRVKSWEQMTGDATVPGMLPGSAPAGGTPPAVAAPAPTGARKPLSQIFGTP